MYGTRTLKYYSQYFSADYGAITVTSSAIPTCTDRFHPRILATTSDITVSWPLMAHLSHAGTQCLFNSTARSRMYSGLRLG